MPSLSSPIRVLIVDDSPLVRRGIRALLGAKRARRTISIVGEATTVAEAVRGATRLKPDVVLLDVRLPDGSGIEACRHIIERQPETSVLILTSHAGDNLLYESVVAGAKGYLMKEIDGEALTTAIIDVAEGRVVLTPDTTARMLRIVRAGPAAASPQRAHGEKLPRQRVRQTARQAPLTGGRVVCASEGSGTVDLNGPSPFAGTKSQSVQH